MKLELILLLTLSFNILFSQTKKDIKKITKDYDLEKIQNLSKKYNAQFILEKKYALKIAEENNWLIKKNVNGRFMELMKINSEGSPIYYSTFNVNAAKSTRANFLYTNGGLDLDIQGENMTAFIWDGGIVRTNHIEYMVNGSSKVTVADGTTNISNHATHVMGTMIARGGNTNARGMAFMANGYSLDWNNDAAEVTSATGFGMLVSNHSYGPNLSDVSDWAIGAYISDSRVWDEIMFDAPYYLLVNAAGNDGTDSTSNASPLENNHFFDQLYGMAISKNVMTVANANDAFIDSNGNISAGGNINNSSSKGPSDDFRIKPDITGNGTLLYSCIGTSNTSYDSYTGTSMASPNVAGTLLLLQQLANQENGSFMLSATLKGLALHTADDKGGIGPDAIYGWGYMNAKKAAELIISPSDIILEKTLNDNQIYTFEVNTDGSKPLEASISWTDYPGVITNNGTPNEGTPALVNDLDIRITKNGITYYPWKLTSVNTNAKADNLVDPFEKIEIANPGNNTYTVSISHKGALHNGFQNYSLIISGITSSTANINNMILSDFDIYPNPSNGIFTIALNNILENDGKLRVIDLVGKTIATRNLNLAPFQQVDLSNLKAGIYYITLIKNNNKTIKKIIIN